MSLYLVRKIARAKWEPSSELAPGALPADVVNDLRSRKNSLSFWEAETLDAAGWEPALTALAASMEDADKIDLVAIPREDFLAQGIELSSTPGDSPTSFNDRHVDAIKLSLDLLVAIAWLCRNSLHAGRHLRKTRAGVVALVGEAAQRGDVQLDRLKPKLAAAIGASRTV